MPLLLVPLRPLDLAPGHIAKGRGLGNWFERAQATLDTRLLSSGSVASLPPSLVFPWLLKDPEHYLDLPFMVCLSLRELVYT